MKVLVSTLPAKAVQHRDRCYFELQSLALCEALLQQAQLKICL